MGTRRRPDPRALSAILWATALLGGALAAPSPPGVAPPGRPPIVRAPADTSAPGGDVRIDADRLVYRLGPEGERITHLYGNVLIERDTVSARADSARHHPDRDLYELFGDVRLRTPASFVTARRGVYDRGRQSADFFGGVTVSEAGVTGIAEVGQSRREGQLLRLIGAARVTGPDYVVWGDTIVQDRATGRSEATGNVRIVDQESQTLVTGQHATFGAGGEVAIVDREPVLTSREQGRHTMEASAELMHFYREDQRVVMIDSVRIRQGPTRARADTAVAYGRDRLVLRGSPRVQSEARTTMSARSIEFLYRDEELQRILLFGRAVVEDTTPDSLAGLFAGLPAFDRLSGDTILVDMDDGEVQRSTVYGGARSVYVPVDLEDEIAFNEVGGDTITLYFSGGQVERVRVQGRMSGVYTFAEPSDLSPVAGPPPVETPGGILPGAAGADTADAAPPAPDAAAAPGSAAFDFAAGADKVDYSGRAVIFDLARRTIEIEGDAQVVYGDMTLTARRIRMQMEDRELYARGDPLLVEGQQKLAGEVMGYDFQHRSGAVLEGVTTYDRNFYEGQEIKRYGDGSLKIRSGRMTACDLEEPHYHFWSDQMKLQLRDKVVARPVVVRIGNVPLFALPFYFKSLKEGRRSGILFPNFNFGWSQRTGRYVRDFGYYWAASDYFDLIAEGDYNERSEFTYRFSSAYVKRYGYRGNFTYARKLYLGRRSGAREWQLDWLHEQPQFLDEYRLNASARLASQTLSSNYLTSDVGRAIVSGELQSRLNLSRSWDAVAVALGLSRTERPNAADENPATNNTLYNQTLPSLSLSFRQFSLVTEQSARGGGPLRQLASRTTLSHSYAVDRSRTRQELTATDVTRATGNWGLELRPPRLWILDFSTSVRGSQNWTRTETAGRRYLMTAADSFFVSADTVIERTSPSLTVGSSVGTSLYGILPVGLGPLQAMRHTLRVGVGHSYQPALGSRQRQGQSFSFSLGNRFDVKLRQAAADTFRERRLDGVLDWNLNTSYNPEAPARRWSIVNSSLDVRPGQSRYLALRVNNTIDPYAWSVLTTRLSYSLSLQGRFDTGESPPAEAADLNPIVGRFGAEADTALAPEGVVPADRRDFGRYDDPLLDGAPTLAGISRDTGGGRFVPWNLNASISVDRDHVTDRATARGNLTMGAALTENWEFAYRASFDFVSGQMNAQSWNLRRDLHCWALEFNRTIYQNDSEFGFRLYLKSIPAVKLTRGKEDLLGTAGALGAGALF